jgi:3-oxoacyl-[acyl-carrier protein] reductase
MKTALITGASTGIGQATALALAADGFDCLITARSKIKLNQTKKMIEETGGAATLLVADLTKIDDINDLIRTVRAKVKNLDSIINIAGIWHGKDEVYADTNFADFKQQLVIDTYMVGFTAPALLVHGLIKIMGKNSKVINLSGTFENGAKGWLPYYASKRALEDFTVGLAQELKDKNIQVNCISPSDTATQAYAKYFPQYMDEAIDPKKIADQIIELCRKKNTTTGKVIVMKKGKRPFEGFHY